MTPIVTSINNGTKYLLSFTTSKEIACMKFTKSSLIGHFGAAISLEYNNEYSKNKEGLKDFVLMVENILGDKDSKSSERYIYEISGKIPLTFEIPNGAKNFKKIKNFGYPFLLGEGNYTDCLGLLATRRYKMMI